MSKRPPKSTSESFGSLLSAHLGLEITVTDAPPLASPLSDSKLVFSTDPLANRKCDGCRELKANCVCVADEAVDLKSFTARIRLEKKGRRGKTVTVIDELPRSDIFLKEWTTRLKKKCGSGGTSEKAEIFGTIEIQGDHREAVRAILAEHRIRTKG